MVGLLVYSCSPVKKLTMPLKVTKNPNIAGLMAELDKNRLLIIIFINSDLRFKSPHSNSIPNHRVPMRQASHAWVLGGISV